MSPTGDLLVTSIFSGEVSPRACSVALKCCTGIAQSWGQHTLWGNSPCPGLHCQAWSSHCEALGSRCKASVLQSKAAALHSKASRLSWQVPNFSCIVEFIFFRGSRSFSWCSSQRSLHNAPIFRLLLKVAVNGTHQCDLLNFCGTQVPTIRKTYIGELVASRSLGLDLYVKPNSPQVPASTVLAQDHCFSGSTRARAKVRAPKLP